MRLALVKLIWDSEMGTGEGRGEALAGLFCGSVHTLTPGSMALGRRHRTCLLLNCVSGTCGSTSTSRTSVPGRKETR